RVRGNSSHHGVARGDRQEQVAPRARGVTRGHRARCRMEDPGVNLTDEEVRELFSAYHDRELPPGRTDAVRAAIEKSPDLRKEYDSFCRMLAGLSNIATGAESEVARTDVDVLAGVQTKLHKRSGGKFYRDRWSRTVGVFPLEVVALLVLVGLVLSYF